MLYTILRKQNYTDEEVVSMIQSGDPPRLNALHFVYVTWRRNARAILLSSGAQIYDVEDAIHEAVIVLDQHIREYKYVPTGSLKNYFIAICKGRRYSNHRTGFRIDYTDDSQKMDKVAGAEPESILLEEELKSLIQEVMNRLDETCQEVLRMFKLSYPMKDIAEEIELSNANNARQWVHKCKQRLEKLVAKHPTIEKYFKDQL